MTRDEEILMKVLNEFGYLTINTWNQLSPGRIIQPHEVSRFFTEQPFAVIGETTAEDFMAVSKRACELLGENPLPLRLLDPYFYRVSTD